MMSSPHLHLQSSAPISEETLAIDWTLSPQDIRFIYNNCSENPGNLLRFSIQLCFLQKRGHFIQDYNQVPIGAIQYLTRQLSLSPVLYVAPPERNATEYRYRDLIREYLKFQGFDDVAKNKLQDWILSQFNNDFFLQEKLLKKAREFLFSQKIILPPSSQLGRMISSLKKGAQQKIFERIVSKVSPQLLEKIDQLLEVPKTETLTKLQELKRSPAAPSIKIFHDYLNRLEMLQEWEVPYIDLSGIHPDLIENFYTLATAYNAWDLKRMSPEKRYSLVICLLVESYKTFLDHTMALNDKMLAEKERRSRHKFNKKLKLSRRQAREAEKVMMAALKEMYEAKYQQILLTEFIAQLNNDAIQQAMLRCQTFHEYEEGGELQELARRYANLRKYTPRLFQLDFKAAPGSEGLLKAIEILRGLNNGSLKSIPLDAPCSFVPANWKHALKHPDGSIRQRTWELALYYAVKRAINSTDLYFPHSRHHRNFWEALYGDEVWQAQKSQAYADLKLPTAFDVLLEKLKVELEQNVQLAKKNLDKDSFAYIGKKGELRLRRDDALDIPESVEKLRQLIGSRLPIIRIEKLLEEIEEELGFSQCFVPLPGITLKSNTPNYLLNAALVAHATNIGIYGMANSTERITADELSNASRRLIYEGSLKAGNTFLLNHYYKHPLSHVYGDGRRASSDAKRYGIRARSLLASYYPRYYGYYDQAISLYTHTSNQYSVFSTLVISCGVREALYVLDGLLSNGSLLTPEFHCTDTHGFTHHIFALCYLLGFSFQPRLKDLASQKLYKLGKNAHYGELDSLFSEAVDVELIREQWDYIVKIAASLKNNLAPAHVIVGKLANRTATDKTAKALMELGKVIKTIFILRYISDPVLRHAVQLQLNRGEYRHYLAQHIFFADQGMFRTNDYEEIMNKASCLSFVSNVILYWNTMHIARIVDQLAAEGYPVNDEDLARISPLMFKHIIAHGMYKFKRAEAT